MENIEQKWIEAVSILITNSSEKVLCPFCKKAYLNVMDIFRVKIVKDRKLYY